MYFGDKRKDLTQSLLSKRKKKVYFVCVKKIKILRALHCGFMWWEGVMCRDLCSTCSKPVKRMKVVSRCKTKTYQGVRQFVSQRPRLLTYKSFLSLRNKWFTICVLVNCLRNSQTTVSGKLFCDSMDLFKNRAANIYVVHILRYKVFYVTVACSVTVRYTLV